MNDKNNILLISENENFSKLLISKLIFLRKNDNIVFSKINDALKSVSIYAPDIILVHDMPCDEIYSLIKDLRKNKSLCIILVADLYDPEFILSAYDCGADDFIMSSAEDFEFVLRIVHNIKHNSSRLRYFRDFKILEQMNVIDADLELYSNKYAKQVIENYIDDNLLDTGCFAAIGPDEESKTRFDIKKMADAIKASTRIDDVITMGKGQRFYFLFPKTDLNQALVVFNKIKEICLDDFGICAGITSIAHKNFEQMEGEVLKALANAAATNSEYVFADEKEDTLDDWLDIDDENKKGYKIFRQMFNKKMEKVITPVFYRLQKSYEEKLFDTEIEQFTDKEQCVFSLRNDNQESTLRIVYPGFTKIIVYITHEGLDSPENKEIQIPLTKITQKELIKIVEDFIKEFKRAQS